MSCCLGLHYAVGTQVDKREGDFIVSCCLGLRFAVWTQVDKREVILSCHAV